MRNRYLSAIGNAPKASLTAKVGLAVSAASLGTGVANFHNSREAHVIENQRVRMEKERLRLQDEQRKLDEKSLSALRAINNKLTTT